MAFTRAQANQLLNKTEMRLFDDSRANALRGLDRSALDTRIARARAARDRSRDLLKRQRVAARKSAPAGRDGVAARTERKEALLVEILERFTTARREAPAMAATKKATTKQATKKTATKKTTTKATKKATTKTAKKATKAPAKQATKATKPPAREATKPAAKSPAPTATAGEAKAAPAATKKAAARKTAAKKKAARSSDRATGSGEALTPERALENTRQLLEAKQERDRSAQPWQSLDPTADHAPQPGYQSSQAASKAQELHAAEARLPSIHGSISTRDRLNQGKRDHRGDKD